MGPGMTKENEKELSPRSPAVEEAFTRLEINGQANRSAAKGEPGLASEAKAVVVSSEMTDTEQCSASFSGGLELGKAPLHLAKDEAYSGRVDSPPGPVDLDGQSSSARPSDSVSREDINALQETNTRYNKNRSVRRILCTLKEEVRCTGIPDNWHRSEMRLTKFTPEQWEAFNNCMIKKK